MACELSVVQEEACLSGIGNVQDEIMLLRLIAQNVATWAGEVEDTPEAILERACESGIGFIQDETLLLKIIAQNLCSQIT